MKAVNAALFGASWWPYASFDTLEITTYLSIWVSQLSLCYHGFCPASTDIALAICVGRR